MKEFLQCVSHPCSMFRVPPMSRMQCFTPPFFSFLFLKTTQEKRKKLAVDSFSIMLYSSILYRIFINRKTPIRPLLYEWRCEFLDQCLSICCFKQLNQSQFDGFFGP